MSKSSGLRSETEQRLICSRSDAYSIPSFGFTNNFYSSYAFTTFTATLRIANGDPDATAIGCISANITPDLGHSLSGVLKFLPLLVLIFVALATAFAGIYSPWGTTDITRWTTNYGRDPDLLRLVTPGFGDCLQYIQFIALTGGLSLNYPGFYQPVVSKVSWSALMFNESLVSHGNDTASLVDGIYVTHGKFGLDKLRQLIGMRAVDDVWAGMLVWLLSIIAIILAIIQVGFVVRWIYRRLNRTLEEDLRSKNMPFSMGNVIRIVFNYFLLPIVALSMFQLVEASSSPPYLVALAAMTLILIVGFTIWLLYLIANTKPKSVLFDDLPTLMLYGSLYNTYSDNAAPFALVPVLLTFVRGIAIGAVQASGIAQLVLLAICEVITVLTLHAFRPFHSPTSMNAFHTFFACMRFCAVLLMISFSPSLGVTDGPKGWVGYAILLMHAIVLVFGFFLNALQTIVEVAARLAGAGGDENGAARGGLVKVFGMRQLSRRMPRQDAGSRQSQLSSAALLAPSPDQKTYLMDSPRPRSTSVNSGQLLNRASTGLDSLLRNDPNGTPRNDSAMRGSLTPETPGGEASPFSFLPGAPGVGTGMTAAEAADPYYRPPRARRPTMDNHSPDGMSRGSWRSGDWANRRWSQNEGKAQENVGLFTGAPVNRKEAPSPQPPVDGASNDRSKADYTTREVDFYYGVRGPALNKHAPSRRVKTGPTDPTGLPAAAVGWVKGFFGNKIKEKGKGFEVVRSAKMPPGMMKAPPPDGVPMASGGIRNGPIDSDDDDDYVGAKKRTPPRLPRLQMDGNGSRSEGGLLSPLGSDDGTGTYVPKQEYGSLGKVGVVRSSDVPPSLPGMDLGDTDIELPSRFPSKGSSRHPQQYDYLTGAPLLPSMPTRTPTVPRKSSRRKSGSADLTNPNMTAYHQAQRSLDSSSHMPFDRTGSSKSSSNGMEEDFTHGQHFRNPSALGGYSADVRGDRPTSVGYVSHNITTVQQDPFPELLGSSAEVVDPRRHGRERTF